MSEPELTCRELVELVTDYLEGSLDDTTRPAGGRAPGGLPRLHGLPRRDAGDDLADRHA